MNKHISDAFGGGFGSPVIDCACGRVNYAAYDDLMDEGELGRLDAKAKAYPHLYCEHQGTDSISAVMFKGEAHVWGCDCQWEEKLQELLDQNQTVFVRYYQQKIQRTRKALEAQVAQLESLNALQKE